MEANAFWLPLSSAYSVSALRTLPYHLTIFTQKNTAISLLLCMFFQSHPDILPQVTSSIHNLGIVKESFVEQVCLKDYIYVRELPYQNPKY